MRMKKRISIVLALVLLASALPLAITSAAAYEKKIPCDADGNNELTKEELVNVILPYMLGEGSYTLDDVGDAAWVYAYWDGKPKTIVDRRDRTVTFYRPVERIVLLDLLTGMYILTQLKATDKVVATNDCAKYIYDPSRSHYFCPLTSAAPELKDLPRLGYRDPSLESILLLKPDVIFTYGSYIDPDSIQEATGILTVCSAITSATTGIFSEHELIGKIVDREEEAEELISYFNEELDELTEITSQINESKRVKVLLVATGHKTTGDVRSVMGCPGSIWGVFACEKAGGINVALGGGGDCGYSYTTTKEQIIEWNPDIIIIGTSSSKHKLTIEDVLSDPDLRDAEGQPVINAIKNNRVYYTQGAFIYKDRTVAIVEAYYFAKLFYPDEFAELNLEEKGNEIFKRVYGVDGLFTEMTEKLDLYRWG
ncbi:hypothetical protein CW713_11880 [Methanophagales archaeon]|nr:MAG: hypothetical protein CW713_11880 [Methanophagales archaeon]